MTHSADGSAMRARDTVLANQAGFTLLELMVATALTVTVMGLSLTALNGAKQVTDVGTLAFETNHNLRAGMNFMVRDLIQAGSGVPTGGIPIPSGVGATAVNRPGPAANLRFADAVLQAVTTGSDLGPMVSGIPTDMVTILSADRSLPLDSFPLQSITNGGARATVDARISIGGATGIRAGDLILFSNAVGNAIQTVTSVNNRVLTFDVNDPFNLNQRNAAQGSIRQIRAGNAFPPTTITRLTMVTYYLDTTTNAAAPRLVRRRNFDPPRPVALVMDSLEITYDLVDGSNRIEPALVNVARLPNGTTGSQIRKANLYLAARSETVDGILRRPFRTSLATQVSLRSLAFVDRYR
jgi:prepilin-type N-terminal cleavage/methylation domain-containing protein